MATYCGHSNAAVEYTVKEEESANTVLWSALTFVPETFTQYGGNITNVYQEILMPMTLVKLCMKNYEILSISKSYGEKSVAPYSCALCKSTWTVNKCPSAVNQCSLLQQTCLTKFYFDAVANKWKETKLLLTGHTTVSGMHLQQISVIWGPLLWTAMWNSVFTKSRDAPGIENVTIFGRPLGLGLCHRKSVRPSVTLVYCGQTA